MDNQTIQTVFVVVAGIATSLNALFFWWDYQMRHGRRSATWVTVPGTHDDGVDVYAILRTGSSLEANKIEILANGTVEITVGKIMHTYSRAISWRSDAKW